jgi:hypothetical protein
MTTKAAPESTGALEKKVCNAGMLPAEPPSPTTGSAVDSLNGLTPSPWSSASSSARSGEREMVRS